MNRKEIVERAIDRTKKEIAYYSKQIAGDIENAKKYQALVNNQELILEKTPEEVKENERCIYKLKYYIESLEENKLAQASSKIAYDNLVKELNEIEEVANSDSTIRSL